jgi:hypothetical protein
VLVSRVYDKTLGAVSAALEEETLAKRGLVAKGDYGLVTYKAAESRMNQAAGRTAINLVPLPVRRVRSNKPFLAYKISR